MQRQVGVYRRWLRWARVGSALDAESRQALGIRRQSPCLQRLHRNLLMSFDHFEYEAQPAYDGAGQSQKQAKASSKKRNVVIDDQHPFDLEVYISQYSGKISSTRHPNRKPIPQFPQLGRAAIKRLRFIADECEQLAPRALQLAVELLTHTRDIALYQATVQDFNSRPGTRDVIPQDTEWVENTSKSNTREKDKLETELKTYSSNMIKESIRVRLML